MYDNEFISKDSVTVHKVENVDNVWERLKQENDVELIKAQFVITKDFWGSMENMVIPKF